MARQFPRPEGSPTSSQVVLEAPPEAMPSGPQSTGEIVVPKEDDTSPVIPAPDVGAIHIRHRPGERPVLDLIRELLELIDRHPDAAITKAIGVRGRAYFADTPAVAQHRMEIEIAYRDTVSGGQARVETPDAAPDKFKARWGALLEAQKNENSGVPNPSKVPAQYEHLIVQRRQALKQGG